MKILFFVVVAAIVATAATAETGYVTVSNLNTLSVLAPKVSTRPAPRPVNFDAEVILQQTAEKLASQYGCSTIMDACTPPP